MLRTTKETNTPRLPDITINLVSISDSVTELRIDTINGRKSNVPLAEIVQSQATGKLYMNLLQQEDPGDENPFILLRDNTGCIEHFNYVQKPDGTRKAISSRYPRK